MSILSENRKMFITVPEAIALAEELGIKVTHATAISWIKKHKLGHQPGMGKWSKWAVNRVVWEDFITGKSHCKAGCGEVDNED